MAKIFLGKPLTAEEIVSISNNVAIPLLDDAMWEKITTGYNRNAVDKTRADISSYATTASTHQLNSLLSTAALLGFCSQAINSANTHKPIVSPAVLRFLLNKVSEGKTTLPTPTDSDLSSAILAVLASDSTLEVTVSDLNAVRSSTGAIAGIAAVVLYGIQALLLPADCVVASVLEVCNASLLPFDSETVRQYTAQNTVAGNIKLLVEGSKRLNKPTTHPLAADDAVVCAPQLHAPAVTSVIAALRIAITEVNATLPPAPQVKLHAQPLVTHINAAIHAINAVIVASQTRLAGLDATAAAVTKREALASVSTHINRDASQQAAVTCTLQLSHAFELLQKSLTAEAAAAESFLCGLEVETARDLAAKEERRAAAAAERERKESEKLAAMTEEQRKQHEAEEAKRKAKAARKAEADAAATAAQGAGVLVEVVNPLGLGPGVAEWRAYLRQTAKAAALSLPPVGSAVPPERELVQGLFTELFAPFSSLWVAKSSGDEERAVRPDVFLRSLVDRIGSGGAKRKAKIAKGARDFMPEQMEVRERCFNIIRGVFKRHGAVEIDTPVFELRETLMGKYGEEGGKLIYDLADQGGELLSLRYDLTVPFARFVAMHGITNIKRYHIARVYRRDNPQMNRGRFREFYQCDFDIAGTYAPMMADAEVLTVASEILANVPIGEFTIKLNHRGLLDAMLDIAGVPASKFRPICSAIDKLDKEPWAVVKEEMVTEKGLPNDVADCIGRMVQRSGKPLELLPILKADAAFAAHAGATAALAELELLFKYMDAMGSLKHITFDLSLARGLDYYTGVIYEAVLLDPTIGVGSIAAGGRYDNLVGMFAPAGTVVPCVGVSIGVERVFAIMEARAAGGLTRTPVSVLVASIPSAKFDMNVERMKICNLLWSAGISAEMVFSLDPKLQKQVTAAAEGNVPFMIVLGEDELVRGEVQLKDMKARTAKNVPVSDIVAHLQAAAAPAAALTASAAATTAETASETAIVKGSVGTVVEGADRKAGKFSRPAKEI